MLRKALRTIAFSTSWIAASLLLTQCELSIQKGGATTTTLPGGGGVAFKQIERLGRPAINEGLVRTNAFLNAFNSIPPSADLSAGAAPVVAEAVTTLDAADAAAAGENITAATVANGFLPDVMRIRTDGPLAVDTAAYNACVCSESISGDPMLCCGRKITDDVMDITLSYLIAGDPSGAAVSDLVSYRGTSGGAPITNCTTKGENPAVPGHQCLIGQTSLVGAGASAAFPFLAKPH